MQSPAVQTAPLNSDAALADSATADDEPSTAPAIGDMTPMQRVTSEQGENWAMRIAYPGSLEAHPPLLAAVQAAIAREQSQFRELKAAMGDIELPEDYPAPQAELSMDWLLQHDSPSLVSVLAQGFIYTGGAHGMPLLDMLHYSPRQQQLLDTAGLFADDTGWERIGEIARQHLIAESAERMQAFVEPEQADELMASVSTWVGEGTRPTAEFLGLFEPVANAEGEIIALKLLFPPYQVSSYAEGIREAVVPLSEIQAFLSEEWRQAFSL